MKHPKIGLALGSGAAKGIAHIGVIKVLEENNIPIDYIAGSSIGALVGAHYAAFKDIKRLEELIINFDRKQGFKLFDPTFIGGLVKGKKFERFIEDMLEGATFDSLQIPFAAVATNFHNARPVVLTDGNLTKAIRASASAPAFFQPIEYNNKLLADGGLSNPVPVDIVKLMGANIVIAVNLDTVYSESNLLKAPPLTKVPVHSIDILRHNLSLQSTKTADVIIAPHGDYHIGFIGWNFFFNTDKTKTVLHAGEKAAEEMLPEIQKILHEKQQATNPLNSFTRWLKRIYK
jgi:NTE family protein